MKYAKDGAVIECTPAEFGSQLEGYFGGKYTAVQLEEVARWAKKHDSRTLAIVYRYCTLNEDTQFGKPPTIKALNKNLQEVIDAYPELSAPQVPLLQDAPKGTPAREWWRLWLEAIKEGVNPRDYEPMREFMRSQGVEPDDPTTQDAG